MQGHAVLLASEIEFGTKKIDGKTVETATFYTLSTGSDTESEGYGGRTFTFIKQEDGTWKQEGGNEYKFNGFGQLTNTNSTPEQIQEAKKLVTDLKKNK